MQKQNFKRNILNETYNKVGLDVHPSLVVVVLVAIDMMNLTDERYSSSKGRNMDAHRSHSRSH